MKIQESIPEEYVILLIQTTLSNQKKFQIEYDHANEDNEKIFEDFNEDFIKLYLKLGKELSKQYKQIEKLYLLYLDATFGDCAENNNCEIEAR